MDYSPTLYAAARAAPSLAPHTQRLNVTYLHDVEFVAPRGEGNHASALDAEAEPDGLAPDPCGGSEDAGQAGTAGDDRSHLDAANAFSLSSRCRWVNSGLPLPVLLRTALLVLNRTQIYYAHVSFQNSYAPAS